MHVKLYLDENINSRKTCKLRKHYRYIGAPIIYTISSRICPSYAIRIYFCSVFTSILPMIFKTFIINYYFLFEYLKEII